MNIKDRVLKEANYIIKTNSTIRETAKVFNISKSTVHTDLSNRLEKIDYSKYITISKILKIHLKNRHILGGKATELKYKKLKLLKKDN